MISESDIQVLLACASEPRSQAELAALTNKSVSGIRNILANLRRWGFDVSAGDTRKVSWHNPNQELIQQFKEAINK